MGSLSRDTSAGGVLRSDTAKTATGTSVEFTGIPSWVRRITVMFRAISTNGTSVPQVQLGSGSFTTSGYLGTSSVVTTGAATSNSSVGFPLAPTGFWGATTTINGSFVVNLQNSSTNTWCGNGIFGGSDTASTYFTAGSIVLSGTLDRIRITTVNGTDAFDAGTINILYE